MIYAMSDIHGCYKMFMKMLDKLALTAEDELYILGDTIDRGSEGIRLILELSVKENVHLFMGNHEHTAYYMLKYADLPIDAAVGGLIAELYPLWLSDGGQSTYDEYMKLDEHIRRYLLKTLKNLPTHTAVRAGERDFLLSHTVPTKEKMLSPEGCAPEDYLSSRPEYGRVYYPDKLIVTGHIPTEFIGKSSAGRIWKGNNHIAIDCGAVFGGPLGCICLDTLEEFYVY